MGNFQGGGNRGGGGFRGGNGGGRPSFGGSRGGDRGPAIMHKAICDECKNSCEVPFRPSSDKPIYCNDCFSSKREGGDRAPRRDFGDRGPKRDFGNRSDSRPSFNKSAPVDEDTKKQLAEIRTKLDRLMSAVEKLSSGGNKAKPTVKTNPVDVSKPKAKKETPGLKAVLKKVVAKKAPAKEKVVKKEAKRVVKKVAKKKVVKKKK